MWKTQFSLKRFVDRYFLDWQKLNMRGPYG